MKRIILLCTILLYCSLSSIRAQDRVLMPIDEKAISEIPRENVFIHPSSSLLFVGEYLYYSFYCLNANDSSSSTLSKIGYVELVSEDHNVVFRQKLRLENGRSSGDFFIPVSLPSGNYKLIGYTKWMLNWGAFFSEDIGIINPYQENQEAILKNSDSIFNLTDHSIKSANQNELKLNLDADSYGKREKVTLKIDTNKKLKGSFSLSVAEVGLLKSASGFHNQDAIFNTYNSMKSTRIEDHLPEARGELISGQITSLRDGVKTVNVKVALSIPNGDSYILKTSNTDAKGAFYFNLNEKYDVQDAVFQVVDANNENYGIVLDGHPALDYSTLEFNSFFITPKMENQIEKRSVHNQIENGYFSVKPDSVITSPPSFPFDYQKMLVYHLDDYTRFKTMKETFVEIIEHVWVATRNDKSVFQLRTTVDDHDYYDLTDSKPLVVVDGILMQNHDPIMALDARKVKTIGIIREKYVYGMDAYQGVIIIQTIDGDFNVPDQGEHIFNAKLFAPETVKNYFKQEYTAENKEFTEHIPDFRYQLAWEPNLSIDGNEVTTSFYTSDVLGTFLVSLKGYTEDGKAITVYETFIVE